MFVHNTKLIKLIQISRKQSWPQSRESREIIGETETRKMAPRRDQSRGLESRLQALVLIHTIGTSVFSKFALEENANHFV